MLRKAENRFSPVSLSFLMLLIIISVYKRIIRRCFERYCMKKFLIILLVIVVLLAAVGFGGYQVLCGSTEVNGEVVVEIPEGSSVDMMATALADKGIIKSPLGFKLAVRLNHSAEDLKAGTYHFKGKNSMQDVLAALIEGPAITGVKVTIPEGYNLSQIISTLVDAGVCTEESLLNALAYGEYGYDYLPAPGDSLRLQGFLFPDTYYISENEDAEAIVAMMLEQFDTQLTDEWKAHLNERGLSVYDWVNMASIVEKEAVVVEDRPIIAGVFYNRLAQGMYLQSCATVQYAQGVVKATLSEQDVQIDSPYNTYKNPGLPPGPIASPGHASLEAALYPADTQYLFFVAKPNGAHIFSTTYDEHLKAKNDIQNGLYDNEQ